MTDITTTLELVALHPGTKVRFRWRDNALLCGSVMHAGCALDMVNSMGPWDEDEYIEVYEGSTAQGACPYCRRPLV